MGIFGSFQIILFLFFIADFSAFLCPISKWKQWSFSKNYLDTSDSPIFLGEVAKWAENSALQKNYLKTYSMGIYPYNLPLQFKIESWKINLLTN